MIFLKSFIFKEKPCIHLAHTIKAEFDSLKNNFQAQIDNYNSSIDSKIDGAIASYLAGISVSSTEEIGPIVPVGEKIISTTGNDYGWKEGTMGFDWQTLTGPYGDGGGTMGDRYAVLSHIVMTNSQPQTPFREIEIKYDPARNTGLYQGISATEQNCQASTYHWSLNGNSQQPYEFCIYNEICGWHRINPSDQKVVDENFLNFIRNNTDGTSTTALRYNGNRNLNLTNGSIYTGKNCGSFGTCTFSRALINKSSYTIVCPDSNAHVWGFYDQTRTLGFCNDSADGTLTDNSKVVGNHTLLTNSGDVFAYSIKAEMSKLHTAYVWTNVGAWPEAQQMARLPARGLDRVCNDWYTEQPDFEVTTVDYATSHNNNYAYYHKPYIGCETISKWSKIGMDYGTYVNGRVIAASTHGTLVNVNGSEYLSPVSGIPIFIATADGTVELELKFEKDADYMPDTNSTYADLYISSKPFKENDLGNGSGVIGPKTGSSSRKLLSDQPAGHGAGSIKVNYDEVTNLIFKVYKDEPIFINFSAYEPSQSSYRGKCTATIQSAIKLTKE